MAAVVDPDLRRLARALIAYARGRADTFRHQRTVFLTVGGQPAATLDLARGLLDRTMWRSCPPAYEGYAAATCPVDLLGPIRDAEANGARLVLEPELTNVACAPARYGKPPAGRRVVIRLAGMRDCARDFALVLVADRDGRLRALDLTLSAP